MTRKPLTIDDARMTGPKVAIRSVSRVSEREASKHVPQARKTIGLGADLTAQPAIPSTRNNVMMLAGLGGIFFALGVGITLALHNPDTIRTGAARLTDGTIEVSRSAVSLLGFGAVEGTHSQPAQIAAQPATQAPTPQALDNSALQTGAIQLSAEQQRQIAAVLALATPSHSASAAPASN